MDSAPDSVLDTYATAAPDGRLFCRGTAFALAGQGVLALGPSGSGKSRLALEMMALGARLIADDGVWLTREGCVRRPEGAPALIEARGIGLLNADPVNTAPLTLIVDLARAEPERLPPRREAAVPGGTVALILGHGHPFLAAAICQYLRHGRAE